MKLVACKLRSQMWTFSLTQSTQRHRKGCNRTQRFCKNESDSSRVILWKTWLESSYHFSQRDSSRIRVTKNRDSSRVIDSSHAITGTCWTPCNANSYCTL